MKAQQLIRGAKPLALYKGRLLYSKGNKVYMRNDGCKPDLLFTLPQSTLQRVSNFSSLLARLLRTGVYSAAIHNDELYVAFQCSLYKFNLVSKQLIMQKNFERSRGPLHFCSLSDIEGFDDGVYYGEYIENPNKNAINVYGTTAEKWRAVCTFPDKCIDHVHALIPDRYRGSVWILTGDFDSGAAIWLAKNNFEDVQPIVQGLQRFRSCIAFPMPDGLLYATDTQFETNSIRMLTFKNGEWVSEKMLEVNGSVIYGCETKDYYVFSTSTEPGELTGNRLADMFDRKPGHGILKNCSDILVCHKRTLKFKVIDSNQKDMFPYRLFQFGTVKFPHGQNFTNRLYAYSCANKRHDMSTEIFELETIDLN